MRLVTRSDFDGLACAVLLRSIDLIEEYKFSHPKDLQDGLVAVTENDVLANVPYVKGCGMWFDHHSSEQERVSGEQFEGSSKLAPSCARVIWDYYGGRDSFPAALEPMMEAVDKVDSANLSREEIIRPSGWVLLGMIMDPRTGLGRYRDYRISNYQLMLDMINYCAEMKVEDILEIPDVKERTDRYFSQQRDFVLMLQRCSRLDGNVLLIDLRNEAEIFSGNRFTVYALYPEANVSIQIIWGLRQQNVVLTVGHSILKRGCTADIGSLMLSHGGGGHFQVGTCQVPVEKAERTIKEVVAALKGK
ncbi:MAG: exopolyphosphatase [Deltaproteobacteria bacterium]|jgi:nanoRNase/pAp phosphatase (c-di-AMP/oligoRNAs hydrolase)|nr:exopolyphosphatase [Deltaproteobacteria bacterium]